MAKSFPCPYCKGEGTWTEVVIEETGQGPEISCSFCDGRGLIVIGGPIHRRIIAERIGLVAITFLKPTREFTYDEVKSIGEHALGAVESYPQ